MYIISFPVQNPVHVAIWDVNKCNFSIPTHGLSLFRLLVCIFEYSVDSTICKPFSSRSPISHTPVVVIVQFLINRIRLSLFQNFLPPMSCHRDKSILQPDHHYYSTYSDTVILAGVVVIPTRILLYLSRIRIILSSQFLSRMIVVFMSSFQFTFHLILRRVVVIPFVSIIYIPPRRSK